MSSPSSVSSPTSPCPLISTRSTQRGGDQELREIASSPSPQPPLPATEASSTKKPKNKAPTPVPWKKLAALTFVLLNESISATMILPFVGYFVAFLTGCSLSEAGYTSGLLIAMFQFAQFLSGKIWGSLSDVYGRRPLMQLALLGSSLSMILFGLSTSLFMAMASRFLNGVLNGNLAIAKTMVAEITDSTNEAIGFSSIAFSWGVGCLIGPFIGGLLYDPVSKPHLEWMGLDPHGTFATHPALLPCLLAALYSLIALGGTVYILAETNADAIPFVWATFWEDVHRGKKKKKGKSQAKAVASNPADDGTAGGDGTSSAAATQEEGEEDEEEQSAARVGVFSPLTSLQAMQWEDARELELVEHEKPHHHHHDGGEGEGGKNTWHPHHLQEVEGGASTKTNQQQQPQLGIMGGLSTASIDTIGSAENIAMLNKPSTIANSNAITAISRGEGTMVTPPPPPPPVATKSQQSDESPSTTNATITPSSALAVEGGGAPDERKPQNHALILAEPQLQTANNTEETPPPPASTSYGYKQVFANPHTRGVVIIYMIIGTTDFGYNEILPLWAIISPERGGVSATSEQLGVLMIAGGICVICSNIAFPYWVKWNGEDKRKGWKRSIIMWSCAMLVIPFTTNFFSPKTAYLLLFPINAVRAATICWSFSFTFIFINAVAPREHLGAVNGVAQACGSLVRAIGPVLFAPLFALSVRHSFTFLFDYHFVWILLVTLNFAAVARVGRVSDPRDWVRRGTREG